MIKSQRAARRWRGFVVVAVASAAVFVPPALPSHEVQVRGAPPASASAAPHALQVDPAQGPVDARTGPGPVRLGLTVLLWLSFLSGAAVIGVRWKRDQSLPLILVVLVVLLGIVAAMLAPGALRTSRSAEDGGVGSLAGAPQERPMPGCAV